MSSKASHVVKSSKVYYLKYRLLYFLLGFVWLILAGWFWRITSSPWFSLFLILQAALNLSLAQITRIVITPDGIAYHNSGFYTIATPWANVDRIINISLAPFGSMRCLVLHQPAFTGWTRLAVLFKPDERGRTIPLTRGWAHADELMHDVLHYAPQVAE